MCPRIQPLGDGFTVGLPEKTKLKNKGYQETPRIHTEVVASLIPTDTYKCLQEHCHACTEVPMGTTSSSPWLMVKRVFP